MPAPSLGRSAGPPQGAVWGTTVSTFSLTSGGENVSAGHGAASADSCTKETTDTGTVDCMCGKQVPLRQVACVWTSRPGQKNCSWFAACTRECIIIHVPQGRSEERRVGKEWRS